MKLSTLIDQLQHLHAERGDLTVDVGLNHEEDGFCSRAVEFVDAENFTGTVMLHGGNVELAEGVTLPAARRLSRELLAERYRQQQAEGWTAAHDDAHTDGSLGRAAAAYAVSGSTQDRNLGFLRRILWPKSWEWRWFKVTTPRRDLVKAGALILAELERLDRLADAGTTPEDSRVG